MCSWLAIFFRQEVVGTLLVMKPPNSDYLFSAKKPPFARFRIKPKVKFGQVILFAMLVVCGVVSFLFLYKIYMSSFGADGFL